MKKLLRTIVIVIAALAATTCSTTSAARDSKVVYAFKKVYACPATGIVSASAKCPGWVADHGIPLCLGGVDEVWNLHWQLKAESYKKDALERDLCRRLKGSEKVG